MRTIQANVNGSNHATFLCPYCESPFHLPVSKYKDITRELTIRCRCKREFKLLLNFRRFSRKNVIIVGEVVNLSKDSGTWTVMTVMNLSMGGVRFRLLEPINMETGDRIRVRFTLDSHQQILLDKEVIVRNCRNNEFGCEFMSPAEHTDELNSYLSQLTATQTSHCEI